MLDQDESRRPKLFVTSGPRAGEPEAFPGAPASICWDALVRTDPQVEFCRIALTETVRTACDDPIRKARSAANASNVGLFPSHKPVFKVAQAFKGPLEG